MALSVNVNLEAYPEGIPLGFVGLGVVENGGTLEVDPAMEPVFHSIYGDTVENVLMEQEGVEVSGTAEFTPPPPEEETQPPSETPPPEVTPEFTVVQPESGLPPGTGGDS
jgi:hypothetical protein